MRKTYLFFMLALVSLNTYAYAKDFSKTSGFYVTMPKNTLSQKQVGTASWYGKQFHGRKTANGETFNIEQFTAAHNSLPFGSVARVTNLNNQRSIKVVINDRGPFVGNRIIDLSKKAAEALGFSRQGVAKVQVEYLHRESNLSGNKLAYQHQHIKKYGATSSAGISISIQDNKFQR